MVQCTTFAAASATCTCVDRVTVCSCAPSKQCARRKVLQASTFAPVEQSSAPQINRTNAHAIRERQITVRQFFLALYLWFRSYSRTDVERLTMLAVQSRKAASAGIHAVRRSAVKHLGALGSAGSIRGIFGDASDNSDSPDLYNYPLRRRNTVINTCDQGRHHVVQRFGKFSHVVEGGLYFTLPFIDTIIEHDMREMTIPISPQTAVTRDNVYTKLSGVLFVQVVDAKKATYGIRRPLISIVKAAEAAMRNALGEMELDDCFREKDKLNKAVMAALKQTTEPWGLEAKRYEVTDIDAAPEIKAAMNLQAAAERQRRETALGAGTPDQLCRKTCNSLNDVAVTICPPCPCRCRV